MADDGAACASVLAAGQLTNFVELNAAHAFFASHEVPVQHPCKCLRRPLNVRTLMSTATDTARPWAEGETDNRSRITDPGRIPG